MISILGHLRSAQGLILPTFDNESGERCPRCNEPVEELLTLAYRPIDQARAERFPQERYWCRPCGDAIMTAVLDGQFDKVLLPGAPTPKG